MRRGQPADAGSSSRAARSAASPARLGRRRSRASAGRRPRPPPRRVVDRLGRFGGVGARARRAASTTLACTSSVSRSVAPMRTRTRAPRARPSAPTARNTSGRVVGANQAVLHHRRVEFVDAVLHQVAQRPVALDPATGRRCSRRRPKRRSRKSIASSWTSLGLNGAASAARLAVARAGDDLPLVDEVDVAAQRRRRPAYWATPMPACGAGLRAHSHLHAGRQARLAAIDGRHAALGEPAAPGAVGEDHRLGDDQVERRAALARA